MARGVLQTEWGPVEWHDVYWCEVAYPPPFGKHSYLHSTLESARRQAMSESDKYEVTVRTARTFGMISNFAVEKRQTLMVTA